MDIPGPHKWKIHKKKKFHPNINIENQVIGAVIFYIFIYYTYKYLLNILPFEIGILILANMDMIAIILSTSIPELFDNTYNENPENFFSYLSTNLINMVAISGILIHGAITTSEEGIKHGIVVMSIMFFVTFLLPTMIIPYIQKKIANYIYDNDNIDISIIYIRFLELLSGIITAAIFIYLEYIILKNFFSVKNKKITNIENFIHNTIFSSIKKIK